MQKYQQRSLTIVLQTPPEFFSFIETCNQIFNIYIDWCFDHNTYNKDRAHKELYFLLRGQFPYIPSALIQSIRDTALESVKALNFKHKPYKKPNGQVRYDKRTISLRGNKLSVSWSGERYKQEISLPNFFKKKYKEWYFQAATIGYDKHKKQVICNLIFEKEKPEAIESDKVLGIDRGLYNIVSTSEGYKYKSNKIRKNKREMLYLKKQLQTKGTKSAKRKLKDLRGYEKRFSLNENHVISKCLVNMPYDIFVLEDLTGIRKQKSKGKKLNKWISNWTFHQLEQFVTYKAEEIGKKVIKVDARYTSQRCSCCGIIDKTNRSGSKYSCSKCGYRDHADINAAKNIRNNYFISTALKEKVEQAEVIQPNVSDQEIDLGTSYSLEPVAIDGQPAIY